MPKSLGKKVGDFVMEVAMWSTDKLVRYARNPRKISPEAVSKTAASIREFGFLVPIIVKPDGEILAGHTRLEAAIQLGLETVPVIVADNLSDASAKAFRIAENRTHTEAKWDFDLLKLEMEELHLSDVDLAMTAFDSFELQPLLADDLGTAPTDEGKSEDSQPADQKPEMRTIKLTVEQHELVGKAIFKVREQVGDEGMSDGRALELIAADYLAGA